MSWRDSPHLKVLTAPRARWALVGAAFAVVALTATLDAKPAKSGAARLVALRTKVDELASELRAERKATQTELARLREEKASLERRVRRARLRQAAKASASKEQAKKLQALEQAGDRWVQPLGAALKRARRHVERSVPFKQNERLAALDRLSQRLAAADPDVEAVLTDLWRFIEQEAALTGEIGVGRQPARVGGQRQLVEVVRLGNALLYFRTAGGEVGWARAATGGGRWVMASDPAAQEAIKAVFRHALEQDQHGPAELWIPDDALKAPGD